MNARFFSALSLCSALLLTLSCTTKEDMQAGRDISFAVSTTYSNGPATKTVFSGEDQDNNPIGMNSTAERIDWLDTDAIRIFCSQASLPGSSDKFADYKIVLNGSGQNNQAGIEPAAGNGLQWGSGSHDFYALYPSNTQNSTATITANGADGVTVTGVIPATQAA